MEGLDTMGVDPKEYAFEMAKSTNHPSVEFCGQSIANCGPFQILWDNYVMVYNDPSQPYFPWYPAIKIVLIFVDFNVLFWPFAFIMIVRTAIWIIKFIGILDL